MSFCRDDDGSPGGAPAFNLAVSVRLAVVPAVFASGPRVRAGPVSGRGGGRSVLIGDWLLARVTISGQVMRRSRARLLGRVPKSIACLICVVRPLLAMVSPNMLSDRGPSGRDDLNAGALVTMPASLRRAG